MAAPPKAPIRVRNLTIRAGVLTGKENNMLQSETHIFTAPEEVRRVGGQLGRLPPSHCPDTLHCVPKTWVSSPILSISSPYDLEKNHFSSLGLNFPSCKMKGELPRGSAAWPGPRNFVSALYSSDLGAATAFSFWGSSQGPCPAQHMLNSDPPALCHP
ncbi:uncharacterized protein LOC116546521 isoform X1 [Sapajus apella]|uniref:Uncharacterized protein LOC116546521 isoform X1 n=1 Tax=Sapajus apella TaxID=9515 RepID=A0A6J3HDS2_SAPAP|nr:uncharacterized protein LOC116546521 isoform X1 [Sapajus apella]